MICDKCDPAGHVGGDEREFLKRMYEERMRALVAIAATINEMAINKRSPDKFAGERAASILRDLDAISHLQIVVGLSL